MQTLITPGTIMFILGLGGVIFSIYNYFREPQIALDKSDALLNQQAKWTIEMNEQRFKDVQTNFSSLLLQSNNHIHTVDTKVDTLNQAMTVMSNEITRLGTIIQERIPKRLE